MQKASRGAGWQGQGIHDAVIVGAGPAGCACAVWLKRLGFSVLLLDSASEVGGLCRGNPFPDPWTLLVPQADGDAVARQLARSVHEAQVPLAFGTAVKNVSGQVGEFRLEVCGADRFSALHEAREPDRIEPAVSESTEGEPRHVGDVLFGRTVVLATGVQPKGRELAETAGGRCRSGVLIGPGAAVACQDYQGKRVAILGGGDNAYENALYVARQGAAQVRVFARNARAQQQLQRQVPAAWVHHGAFEFDLDRLCVDGEIYDLILVFYGWEPALGPARTLALALDEHGFVETDRYTAQTSVEGVYAIGELTRRQHPCVLTAMADGVVAAKAVQARLESTTSTLV